MSTTTQRQGFLLIACAAAGYAILPVIAKFAYDAGLKPLDVITWRFIFATPIIWLLVWRFGRHENPRSLPGFKLLLMGCLFAIIALPAFYALERVPASTYIVLAFLYPAFVALFSMLAGENLSSTGWLALGLTLIGVALTVPDFASGFRSSDVSGILLSLVNGFGYAIYVFIGSRLLRGQTAMAHATAISITGTLIFLLCVALLNGLAVPPTLTSALSLVTLGLLSTVMPIFAVYVGVQKLGAAQAAILGTLEPVIVVVLSFLLLGEKMEPIQILGGALILFSSVLLQLRRPRPVEPAPAGA